jgi:uncharacterized protein (DUF427 family)
MSRTQKRPGPDHPITLQPSTERIVVRLGHTIIADTQHALTMREAAYPPVYYIPLADVDPSVLRPSTTTTYCPYKGDATYHSLTTNEDTHVPDALWTYRQPYPDVAPITGHVAFYPDKVQIDLINR